MPTKSRTFANGTCKQSEVIQHCVTVCILDGFQRHQVEVPLRCKEGSCSSRPPPALCHRRQTGITKEIEEGENSRQGVRCLRLASGTSSGSTQQVSPLLVTCAFFCRCCDPLKSPKLGTMRGGLWHPPHLNLIPHHTSVVHEYSTSTEGQH